MKKRRPVTACLQLAIERLWSGRIELYTGEEAVGQLVFVNGRIAWATATGQTETLGSFLWRLGRLTREQLGLIQQRFKQSGGRKRLGALLEESGYMTRPMLRRALLLHTRSAVERLLSLPNTEGVMYGGDFAADEAILFGPDEVLPADWQQEALSEWFRSDTTQVRHWHLRTEENAILEAFSDLGGYSAAAVVAAEGDVLCAHCSTGELDMALLAISVAATIESASRAVKVTLLDHVDVLTLESSAGVLTTRWIDDEQKHLLLVLTEEGSNPSLMRYAIKTEMPAIKRWLAKALKSEAAPDESGDTTESPAQLAEPDETFTSTYASVGGSRVTADAFSRREQPATRAGTGTFDSARPEESESSSGDPFGASVPKDPFAAVRPSPKKG